MRFSNIFLPSINKLEEALTRKPLFAIRHKETGRFLPRPPSGQRGGSWVEPTSVDLAQPRFFPTKGAAKGFLTSWCKGPIVRRESYDISEQSVWIEHNLSMAKEPRIAEEYEVVEIFWGVKK